jgi:hypothetical protein
MPKAAAIVEFCAWTRSEHLRQHFPTSIRKYREKYSNAMLIYWLPYGGVLTTNLAGLGGSLNAKLPAECPSEL